MRRYAAKSAKDGKPTSTQGYNKHLMDLHQVNESRSVSKKEQQSAAMRQHLAYVNDNQKHFDKVFKLHGHLTRAKEALISALKGGVDPESGSVPKAFVVIHNGVPMKLADRKRSLDK